MTFMEQIILALFLVLGIGVWYLLTSHSLKNLKATKNRKYGSANLDKGDYATANLYGLVVGGLASLSVWLLILLTVSLPISGAIVIAGIAVIAFRLNVQRLAKAKAKEEAKAKALADDLAHEEFMRGSRKKGFGSRW